MSVKNADGRTLTFYGLIFVILQADSNKQIGEVLGKMLNVR